MSEREHRGANNVESLRIHSRTWSAIDVQALEIRCTPGKAWHNLSSNKATLGIVLEQHGGQVEPRLKLDQPLKDKRWSLQHIDFIPAGMPLWGYSESIRGVRSVRISFGAALPDFLDQEGWNATHFDTPNLMIVDERITRLGELLARECKAGDDLGQLYAESLLTALAIASSPTHIRREPNDLKGRLSP